MSNVKIQMPNECQSSNDKKFDIGALDFILNFLLAHE